jgi:hypothetical protein
VRQLRTAGRRRDPVFGAMTAACPDKCLRRSRWWVPLGPSGSLACRWGTELLRVEVIRHAAEVALIVVGHLDVTSSRRLRDRVEDVPRGPSTDRYRRWRLVVHGLIRPGRVAAGASRRDDRGGWDSSRRPVVCTPRMWPSRRASRSCCCPRSERSGRSRSNSSHRRCRLPQAPSSSRTTPRRRVVLPETGWSPETYGRSEMASTEGAANRCVGARRGGPHAVTSRIKVICGRQTRDQRSRLLVGLARTRTGVASDGRRGHLRRRCCRGDRHRRRTAPPANPMRNTKTHTIAASPRGTLWRGGVMTACMVPTCPATQSD